MSLSVGIVGLPNVGKSTLFNALLKKQLAYAANFPFATIEPNIGVVPVPDERLSKLAEVVKESEKLNHLPPEVPATIQFVDIAGLIAGAHKGEGLGNKFLSHIREVDAIMHVVRSFKNEDIIKEGSVDPESDFSTVETELMMADLATLEKQKEVRGAASKEDKDRWSAVTKVKQSVSNGIPARAVELTNEEEFQIRQLTLLTKKPILVALNCDEEDLKNSQMLEENFAKESGLDTNQVTAINAKLEEELAGLDEQDRLDYLSDLGLTSDGLTRIIKKAFSTLDLITFLTAGEKEVRAWTIHNGINAQQSAGVIHTDFEKKFIKADIVSFEDFVGLSGWKIAREKGRVRQEGKEYIMDDGEVVEFKIGS